MWLYLFIYLFITALIFLFPEAKSQQGITSSWCLSSRLEMVSHDKDLGETPRGRKSEFPIKLSSIK